MSSPSQTQAPPGSHLTPSDHSALQSDSVARENISDEVRRVGRLTTDMTERTRRDGDHIPLKLPGQAVVLLNVAHRGLSTRSEEASFRILGIFSSNEEAIEAAADFPQDVAIYMHPTQKFKYVGPEALPPDEELARVQEMFESCRSEADRRKTTFDERMERAGRSAPPGAEEGGGEGEEEEEEEQKEEEEETDGGGAKEEESPPERLRRIHELRDQSCAAIGLLLDEKSNECCLIVFGCFGTTEECERYVVNTLSDEVRDYELFVVGMYEWLFPFQVLKKGGASRVGYRHVKLNDVMTYRAGEKARVQEYVKRCESQGMSPAVTEIDETGVVSKSTLVQAAGDGDGEGEGEVE